MSIFRKIKAALTGSVPPPIPQSIPQPSQGLAALAQHLRTLDPKVFSAIASRSERPSERDVASFEKTIGFRLPDEFREFLMASLGCFYLEAIESAWPRPKPDDIVPAWHLKYAIHVFGISSDAPDFMDIRKRFAGFPQSGSQRLVPFFAFSCSGDCHCFTPEGRIVVWRSDSGDTQPVDLTFSAFLLKEIRTLQERAQKITNEPNPYA